MTLTLSLKPSTEEWAEHVLRDLDVDTVRSSESLTIIKTIGGNCDAIQNAMSLLDDVATSFREGEIDVMEFELKASSSPPAGQAVTS